MTIRMNIVAQLAGASSQLLIDTLPVAHDWHPWLRGLAAFVQLLRRLSGALPQPGRHAGNRGLCARRQKQG